MENIEKLIDERIQIALSNIRLEQEIISEKELCAMLHTSTTSLWRKRREGKFPEPRCVFGRNVYLMEDVRHFINPQI